MEQRRLFVFLGLSVSFLILWGSVIRPVLFPRKPVEPLEANAKENPADDGKDENPIIAKSDSPENSDPNSKKADKPVEKEPQQKLTLLKKLKQRRKIKRKRNLIKQKKNWKLFQNILKKQFTLVRLILKRDIISMWN